MPETAQAIHDSKDLPQQVDALLDTMESGTQRLAEEAAALPSSTPEGSPDAELAQAVDQLAAPAPVNEADLAAAVEKLIDQAPAAPAQDPPAPAVPAASAEHIDSLDAELAGLADNLIAGEFTEEPIPEAATPQPSLPGPAVPAPVETAHEPATTAAPSEEPRREPAPVSTLPPPPLTPAPVAAAPVPAAAPLALRVLSVASAPVRANPHLRDALGWIALVQGFLGVCVWVYVMFFRSNIPLDPPPLHAADHAEKAHSADKGHGEKAKPAAEKKTAKKAAAKSGGHH